MAVMARPISPRK